MNTFNPTVVTKDTLSLNHLSSPNESSPINKLNKFHDVGFDINKANFAIGANFAVDPSEIGNGVDNYDAISNVGL